MRLLPLLCCGGLLLCSSGCGALKFPMPAVQPEAQETLPSQPAELSETAVQLTREALDGGWLNDFVAKQNRRAIVLPLVESDQSSLDSARNSVIQTLLDSGRINLALPKNQAKSLSLPADPEAALILASQSGADFLLHFSLFASAEPEIRLDLTDLMSGNVVFSKAIIIHKLKI